MVCYNHCLIYAALQPLPNICCPTTTAYYILPYNHCQIMLPCNHKEAPNVFCSTYHKVCTHCMLLHNHIVASNACCLTYMTLQVHFPSASEHHRSHSSRGLYKILPTYPKVLIPTLLLKR